MYDLHDFQYLVLIAMSACNRYNKLQLETLADRRTKTKSDTHCYNGVTANTYYYSTLSHVNKIMSSFLSST